MASRIISLLRILNRNGGQVTSSAPNSWAMVGTWRRFFEIKEQEDEERVDAVEEIIEGLVGINGTRPIAADEALEARKEFVKEHYRDMIVESIDGRMEVAGRGRDQRSYALEHEDQQLNRPSLTVPVGESYMTLAQ